MIGMDVSCIFWVTLCHHKSVGGNKNTQIKNNTITKAGMISTSLHDDDKQEPTNKEQHKNCQNDLFMKMMMTSYSNINGRR